MYVEDRSLAEFAVANAYIIDEGSESVEVVGVTVIGWDMNDQLRPPAEEEVMDGIGHEVEVGGREVQEKAELFGNALSGIGDGTFGNSVCGPIPFGWVGLGRVV